MTVLYTGRWKTAYDHRQDLAGLQVVSASFRLPRYWLPVARTFPAVPAITPDGWMLDLKGAEFDRAYFGKLAKVNPRGLAAQFDAISQQAGGAALLLCCFEEFSSDCHRSSFAAWWHRMRGELVEEWHPTRIIATYGRGDADA